MFGFGLVMICQGLVTSWGGLMTTRFFLGVFESGMFPGCESPELALPSLLLRWKLIGEYGTIKASI